MTGSGGVMKFDLKLTEGRLKGPVTLTAPDGQSQSGTIDVVSPYTEEVVGRVPEASPADVDRAVAAARQAFDRGPWPQASSAALASRWLESAGTRSD